MECLQPILKVFLCIPTCKECIFMYYFYILKSKIIEGIVFISFIVWFLQMKHYIICEIKMEL